MNAIALVALKTIIFYVLIVLIFRLMGKREIGELSILDLVVYILIAEIAAMGIESSFEKLPQAITPILLLMVIQIVMAMFSLKSKRFRDIIEGQPVLLINKGKIDEKEMKRQRYNFDDLLLQLREQNVRNIADVEFAILETSGKLSVFEKEKKEGSITLPLIIDGEIQEKHLERIEKNDTWLRQQLQKRGYKDINEISFCSFQNGTFFIDLKDGG